MSDFSSLKAIFKGDLVTPESSQYTDAIARWAINASKKAQVVAFAKDAQDVALAIKYARDNKLDFAIKGGGHSSAGNSSSTGIVVDLTRYLNKVEIDEKKQLGYVGGGCIWADVDKAAIDKGLATVAGTVNHTGVAGLTLGGGFGWLSGQHGLAIDNLVQASVVIADGRVLTASAAENSDLFFGIRGGGSNFGVVVEFVFKLHPQRKTVYAGGLIWPAERLEEIIEVTNKWYPLMKPNEGMMHGLARAPNGAPAIKTMLFFNGTEVEGRENFKAILDLKPIVDQSGEIPYENLNGLFGESVCHGKGRAFKGAFFKDLDVTTVKEVFERVVALSTPEHELMVILEYYYLGKIMSVPNGETAFVRHNTGSTVSVATWTADTPENSAIGRAKAREVSQLVSESQKKQLDFMDQGYGNYDQAGCEEEHVGLVKSSAQNLFGDNYPKLQEIKAKYDPENFFANWFAILPAGFN